jgi:hypothetical protein
MLAVQTYTNMLRTVYQILQLDLYLAVSALQDHGIPNSCSFYLHSVMLCTSASLKGVVDWQRVLSSHMHHLPCWLVFETHDSVTQPLLREPPICNVLLLTATF